VDDKNGIKRYIAALNAFNREFEAPQKELETLANRITALTNEINAAQSNTPGLAAKVEELDRLKLEFDYKQKNGKAAFEKRQKELLIPIENHIFNEVKNYAKQFGIKVVIDVGKIQDAVVFYSEEADMTRAFIADYNAKFPAGTTLPATTPAKQP
jgi:Skp family chaperone for outer membrane proteins